VRGETVPVFKTVYTQICGVGLDRCAFAQIRISLRPLLGFLFQTSKLTAIGTEHIGLTDPALLET
jgi:hypothetical protein